MKVLKPLITALVTISRAPVSIPAAGPKWIAEEMVALLAHNVVGHD